MGMWDRRKIRAGIWQVTLKGSRTSISSLEILLIITAPKNKRRCQGATKYLKVFFASWLWCILALKKGKIPRSYPEIPLRNLRWITHKTLPPRSQLPQHQRHDPRNPIPSDLALHQSEQVSQVYWTPLVIHIPADVLCKWSVGWLCIESTTTSLTVLKLVLVVRLIKI